MAMGKRETEEQRDLFVMADKLPRSPEHVFYGKLNCVLREGGFDRHVESLCEPHYAQGKGRPSLPPGVYFRTLIVDYFEWINSQRGIAWRCGESLSLRKFLGIPLGADSPDHSSRSYIRNRLPLEVHQQVFVWILALANEKKLLKGKTVAVDSTTLEANAAMKSIVRNDAREDWNKYLTRLKQEARLLDDRDNDDPLSADELRKFDKNRDNKRVSNEEWTSPTDADSRIAKMKNGTTHLAYKAEHVVDLDTEMIVAAEIYYADQADTRMLEDSVNAAQVNQLAVGSEQQITDVVADKGYHANEQLAALHEDSPYRKYMPAVLRKRNPHHAKADVGGIRFQQPLTHPHAVIGLTNGNHAVIEFLLLPLCFGGTAGQNPEGNESNSSVQHRSPNERHRMAEHNRAAVGSEIAHSRGGHAAEEGCEAAQYDDVGWANADAHVADAGRGHAADECGDATGGQDRSADVWHQDRHHRANVHVGDASARHSHGSGLFQTMCADSDPVTIIEGTRCWLREKVKIRR